jgi:hypothetical protein
MNSMTRIARNNWYAYVGTEHPYLRYTPIKTIRSLGRGRWEVTPWIDAENRCSWVTSDPLAADLRSWPAGQPLPQESAS